MILHVYEPESFVKTKEDQLLVYFESKNREKENHYTFESFVKECMTKEILMDSFYTLNLISNRKDIAKIVSKEYTDAIEYIEYDILHEVYTMLDEILYEHHMSFPKQIIQAVRIYDHEWDYLFYVIEDESGFYGFNWTKSNQIF